ncbi:NAD-dependent epimerase/dehydratase family protein [Maioricimonas sp. JC845]|uniref:NAD-dependent epimerase/dehydratase family protein n=1 Tax=Maioricimonas sp. JC845 TaxID=3232138 RepID=UPI003457899A
MHALVTGGGGFLGRYIVEQLVARGETVRVLCRGQYPELDALGVETVRGDVRDAETVRRATDGCEAVFHVAAIPGVWGPWQRYYSINVEGTENVLDACRAAGVRKLIYTSSPSVVYDGQPHVNADESLPYPDGDTYLCHYPHTKAIAERKVLEANGSDGLCTAALRPHLIWGPRDNHLIPRLIQRAKSGRLRQVGDGTNEISMSYVENVAAAHLQVCDRLQPGEAPCGQAYFINESEPVLLWEWVNRLLTTAGLPPVKKSISSSAARRVGAALEGVYTLFRLPGEPPMTRFVASQLSQSHSYRIEKAERDFGYRPLVSVDEGLAKLEPELRALAGT